jgi:dihydroorotate dehydrogenase (NAD+) catalytic subunit
MLETAFLNQKLRNPLVLASGVRGVTASSLKRMVEKGCGGVTLKSISLKPRSGHANPTLVANPHFVINAVGLSNPGVDEIATEITSFKKVCRGTPLIGSVYASSVIEFVEAAEKLCETEIDVLELNLSCPNVSSEFGEPFAHSVKLVGAITSKVKAVIDKPLTIKLSPNISNIATIAKAAEDNGADAITAVNTLSGMLINVGARCPVLHNKTGGVSGPALYPVALKCVNDIYRAVKIPIIGTGGVNTGEEALGMIMAGACLVGVGSAVYYRGETVFKEIVKEMDQVMKQYGIKSLDEIRGNIF